MATSGPITYLVIEDQFPLVAAPRERLPQSMGISSPRIGMRRGTGWADASSSQPIRQAITQCDHSSLPPVQIAEYAMPVDAGFVMSERYRTTGSGVPATAKSASVQGRSVTRWPSRLATTRPSRAAAEGGDLGRSRDRVIRVPRQARPRQAWKASWLVR